MRNRRVSVWLVMAAVVIWVLGSLGVAAGAEPDNYRFTEAEGPMGNGVPHAGVISASGDWDTSYFYVPSRGDVTLTLSTTARLNMFVNVYRYSAGGLVYVCDLGAFAGEEEVHQLDSGLYYVDAFVTDHYTYPAYPIAYQVTVSGSVSSSAPSSASTHRSGVHVQEINETDRSSAQNVSPFINYVGDISAVGDIDWYKFSVASRGEVRIGVTKVRGGAVSLDVHDAAGMKLFGVRQESDAQVLDPGVYYVSVDTYYSNPPIEYVFSIQGDTLGQAPPPAAPVPLSVGGSRVTGNISTAGEADWYQLSVPASGPYVIATIAGTLGDTFMELYASDRSTLIESDDDDGEGSAAMISRALSPGTYYLKVRGYNSSATGTYSIGVSTQADPGTTDPVPTRAQMQQPTVWHSGGVRTFRVMARMTPDHPDAHMSRTSATRFMFYRYRNGKWVYQFSRSALTKRISGGRMELTTSVTCVPGKWRVRSYHKDAGHLASYSPFRSFIVR